jgi:hypothetical protein
MFVGSRPASSTTMSASSRPPTRRYMGYMPMIFAALETMPPNCSDGVAAPRHHLGVHERHASRDLGIAASRVVMGNPATHPQWAAQFVGRDHLVAPWSAASHNAFWSSGNLRDDRCGNDDVTRPPENYRYAPTCAAIFNASEISRTAPCGRHCSQVRLALADRRTRPVRLPLRRIDRGAHSVQLQRLLKERIGRHGAKLAARPSCPARSGRAN